MKSKIITSAILVAFMWGIFIFNAILPIDLNRLGILPRHISGLWGLLFAPFLHASLMHIVSNSLPVFVLTLALLFFYENISVRVWAFSAVLGGFLTWGLARGNTYHIGASGVIFSLIGFLIASGIFRRSIKSLLIAIVIFFVYGGTIWGVLPTHPWISWESHLFGFITGVFLAYIYRNTQNEVRHKIETFS